MESIHWFGVAAAHAAPALRAHIEHRSEGTRVIAARWCVGYQAHECVMSEGAYLWLFGLPLPLIVLVALYLQP